VLVLAEDLDGLHYVARLEETCPVSRYLPYECEEGVRFSIGLLWGRLDFCRGSMSLGFLTCLGIIGRGLAELGGLCGGLTWTPKCRGFGSVLRG